MVNRMAKSRLRRTLDVLAATLVMSVALTASPVMAQDLEGRVSLADGVWEAVMLSFSTVAVEGGGAAADFRGNASFLSVDGVLEGEWTVGGSGVVTAEGASGTAEYSGGGNVTGSADQPLFPATNLHIEANIVIDGVARRLSQDLPAGDSFIRVELTHATCSQVIGQWEYATGGLDAHGTFVAIRVEDLVPGAETDYNAEVTELIGEAIDFREATIRTGLVDVAALARITNRAQNLNRSLRRATECDPDPPEHAERYLSLIAGVISDLVGFALDNPLLFDDAALKALSQALVNTGAAGAADAVWDGLRAEWADRLEAAIEAGDEYAILDAISGAAIIGAWDLIAIGEAALSDE
jgi:hypothetical protein